MKGNLNELNIEELDKALVDSKIELRKERFSSATSKLDNTKKIQELKRHVARILTVKREHELGIRKS